MMYRVIDVGSMSAVLRVGSVISSNDVSLLPTVSAFGLHDGMMTAQKMAGRFNSYAVVSREAGRIDSWLVMAVYYPVNIHVVTVPPVVVTDADDDCNYRYCDGCGADKLTEICICDFI